ncbi:hypothetical protein DPMN_048489 [Dreissena polymorpha]|uniref:Uncharacterized protein n=1 Tax=Dreissena polymorpha TaxID=45954 RepID=A0A9D4DA40_DREPO|nr:hypothetical protein DPMN_048489 [Dreissena polymorpha]
MPRPLLTFLSALFKGPKYKLFQSSVRDIEELLQSHEDEVHKEAEEQLLHGPLPTQTDHPPQVQTETWLRDHKSTQLHCLFQMLVYISHSGLTRTPLHMMLGHTIYERDRSRSIHAVFLLAMPCNSQKLEKPQHPVLSPKRFRLWMEWTTRTMLTNHRLC